MLQQQQFYHSYYRPNLITKLQSLNQKKEK